MIKIVSKSHAIIKQDIYRGIKYKICFLRAGFYTCYLDVAKTSLYSIDYNNIDLPVHWGLTYGDYRYPWEKDKDPYKYIIGWDYGHCDDAYENDLGKLIFGDDYFEHRFIGNVHHTIEELILDCKEAIDEIWIKGYINETM